MDLEPSARRSPRESLADEFDEDEDAVDVPIFPGAEKAHPRLLKWLKKIVDSLEQEEPVELTLYQVTVKDGEKSVFQTVHELDQTVDETVNAILQAALDDLDTARFLTRVSYTVRVDGRKDRINFSIEESSGRTGIRGSRHREYFADAEGIIATQMEINVQYADRVLEMATANNDDHRLTITELREENRYLKRHEWELRKQIERLMNGQMQRAMMMEEFQREQKRKDDAVDTFKKIGPSLAAYALGPNAGAALAALTAGGIQAMMMPGGEPPEPTQLDVTMAAKAFHHIDKFIAALERRPDLFPRVMQLLSEEQECVVHLAELHKDAMVRREQANAAAAPQNGHNGSGQRGKR